MKIIQQITIENKNRFKAELNKELIQKTIDYSLNIVKRDLDQFIKQYPHVSENFIYPPEDNKLWTASFFPGMVFLAYELSGDSDFLRHSEDYLDSFEDRLLHGHTVTHDIGFLCTLSCVANYKLTKSERAMHIANLGADILIRRYNEKGKYIQAWGEIGISYPEVKIIIDTMLNLPLLYWTENAEKIEIAKNHALTCAENIIRHDASSYHTYLMNPETGEAVVGKTHQGNRDESTWARGQGWAVYGFALSYAYTKEEYFLEAACKCADYFLNHLPKDFIPYWDFDFTDDNPDIKDTSAGAILACGLLEICKHLDGDKKDLYYNAALCIIHSLCENYTTKDMQSNGLLKEGMYHRNDGFEECVIWGDYYFMEALTRLTNANWNRYW